MKYQILTTLLFLGNLNLGWSQNIIDTVFFDDGGIDSYTNSGASTTNYGSDTCFRVYYDYGSPSKSYYSYLQADFSDIPSNAIVTDATFSIYAISVSNGADHTMALQRLTTPWTETGITWTTYPTATGVNAVTMSDTATSALGWQSYNTTNIVRYQVTNPTLNYGWRILLSQQSGTVDKGVIYASSENANSAIRPYVIVEYYVPPSDTIYFETSKDARVYRGSTGTNYGSDSTLAVGLVNSGSNLVNRTFLYADLSHIPRNSLISIADVHMNALSVDNTGTHPMYFEGVNAASWSEGSITWTNQPTVWASYRAGISHANTSSTGWQQTSVVNLAQYAVWLPEKNYGWRMALQNETDTTHRGVVYASSENDSVEIRPYMFIEYLPPIEIEGFVTHCSNGNNDGSIEVSSIIGGCKLYTSYNWRKLSGGTLTSVETGSDFGLIDVSGLSDGLYLLEVQDYRSKTGYKYFFVGEEGDTTNVEFGYTGTVDRVKYTEDSWVTWVKSSGDSSNVGGSATTVGCYTNTSYDSRTFINYKVDWDPALEFTNAEQRVTNKGGCTQGVSSDNDAWISRVTEPWGEMYVTWATRPDVTTDDRFYIPTTTTNGNEARNDTFDILAIIPYWQEHQDENFGFELALNDYTQAASAARDYNSSDQTGHNLVVSYTVKPAIETSYSDSLGTGTILVNAPDAELPYTYFISTVDTLPPLDSLWQEIGGLFPIDSASFFAGKSNTRNFAFENLPCDQYYIGVYDNRGSKIYDGVTYVKPSLKLKDTVDIIISGDTLSVAALASSAKTTYYGEFSNNDPSGVELTITQLAADVVFGLNQWADAQVNADRDFEYSLVISTSATATFFKGSTSLGSFSVAVGDRLRLASEYNEINVYKNGVLTDTEPLDPLHYRTTWKAEIKLKATAASAVLKPYGKIPPKGGYVQTQPTCDGDPGALTIYPSTFFGYSLTGYTLTNVITSSVFSAGPVSGTPVVISNIPIGVYNLTTTWSNGTISLPSVTTQLVFGLVVEWVNEYNIVETPLNTIKSSPPSSTIPGTANSANATENNVDYWVRFEPTFPKFFSHGLFEIESLSGQEEISIEFFQFFGMKYLMINSSVGLEVLEPGLPYVLGYISGDPVAMVLPATGPFLIAQTGGDIKVIFQNNEIVEFPTAINGDVRIEGRTYGYFGIANTFASFCYAVNPFIAKTKPFQDGSYYNTKQGNLNFQYTGEYNTSDLTYQLTDESGNLISSGLYTLTVTGSTTDQTKKNADNRYTLDFESLNSGFYLLTVINVKGEKHYIRIKN